MNEDRQLSRLVLPEPVPPDTMMFCLAATRAESSWAESCVSEPKESSFSIVSVSLEKRRIATDGPSGEIGGSNASMREPSGSRPSRMGW